MSYQPPQQPPVSSYDSAAGGAPVGGAPGRNRIGVIALIVGIVAFVGAFVPVFNYLAILIALAAVVLGIVGLIRPGKKGAAIAGAILGFFGLVTALILAIVYTFLFFGHLIGAASGVDGLEERVVPLVYQVDGTGSDVDITYSTAVGGVDATEQELSQSLPFEQEFEVGVGGENAYSSFTVTAVNGADGGDVICRIVLDGQVLVEQESSGAYATASCTANASQLLQ